MRCCNDELNFLSAVYFQEMPRSCGHATSSPWLFERGGKGEAGKRRDLCYGIFLVIERVKAVEGSNEIHMNCL